MEDHALEDIDAAVAELQELEQERLLQCENVQGVGVGRKVRAGRETGEPCVTVFVSQKVPKDVLRAADRVPSTLRQCNTDVVELGPVFAGGVLERATGADVMNGADGSRSEALGARTRPAFGGCSVGHYRVHVGSIATGVIDSADYPGIPRSFYLLSNNHVLANANQASIGDPIVQPAPADGGRVATDTIGRLARFVPLHFDGQPNLVDAAIAEVPFEALERYLPWIGHARESVSRVRVGQILRKTGRTTGYTTGVVRTVNTTLDVRYGDGAIARFTRQIVTSKMSAPGDWGSLAVESHDRPVGLLFAGSCHATVLNPIGFVESALQIRIGV